MTAAVTDSTVLIYLTRLGELSLLRTVFEDILVPEPVYDEVVVRGRSEGYRDAMAIDAATDEHLEVVELAADVQAVADRVREKASLGSGEAAVIAVAADQDARCLTDDHAARSTATAMDVKVGGTIFVLLSALEAGVLSLDEYLELLDALSESGFRMSASLYRRAIDAGESMVADR